MSNEITTVGRLKIANGNLNFDTGQQTVQINMAGKHLSDVVQSIPTTAGGTAVTIGASVATLGVAQFQNMDATNYVQLGVVVSATFYPFVRIKPGEISGPIRLDPGVTLYARANTAACDLRTIVAED